MMKRKMFYPYILITTIALIMILAIVPSSSLFGSNTDWLSQHVSLADSIRTTILETKNIFPDFIFNLGGGQNIYNISYYGLFRPDVLIGCLIPNIMMKDILVTYMIINICLSVNLMYFWLNSKNYAQSLGILGAILLLSSSLLFQSHRQVMFVDYMAGVLFALIGVDQYINRNKSWLVIGAVIFIIVNSYFFAISSLLAIFTYYLYEMNRKNQKITLRKLWLFIKQLLIGVLICGVLLLPTAYVMIENHQSGNSAIAIGTLLVRCDFQSLLYNVYGCGLSYITWVAMVLSLKLKQIRKLSVWLLLLLFVPLFSFVLNGFLYPRYKILIPFIPLIIYVVIFSIYTYQHENIELDLKMLVLMILPGILFYQEPLVIIDIMLCLLYLKINKQTMYLLMVMPLIISYVNNQKESFVTIDTYNQIMKLKEIKFDDDSRFDIFSQSMNTVNQIIDNKPRTSIYSSISNDLYNQFYFDVINNPISIKNRVACLSNSNIFFQGMMAVKTLYSEAVVPIGYEAIGNNLYQNNDVLPLVYATNNTYSLKAFKHLTFPKTLDTLYNNVVVEDGDDDYQSRMQDIQLEPVVKNKSKDLRATVIDSGYRIDSRKNGFLDLAVNQDLTNKILVIEFDVDQVKFKQRDTSIEINSVINKLSGSKAAYPNKNTHFTYILSQSEKIDNLNISFSQGQYDLKNIKMSILDYDVIKKRKQQVTSLVGKYNQNNNIVNGNINVSEDGYLVTSLPYQNGYSLYIDGNEVQQLCVNKAFLGSKITKGNHQVRITFKAPLKNLGLMCSGVGIVLLVLQGSKWYEKGCKRIN